jgi:hypothetical protein
MGLLDRGIRRALRDLDDGEVVVASLTGLEAEGRRRRFIVVTGHRMLIGSARGDEPTELALHSVTARFDRGARRLSIDAGESETTLREVDELAARALVEVVAQHRQPQADRRDEIPRGVTVIDDLADGSSVA